MKYRLVISAEALKDIQYWVTVDRKIATKIMTLLEAITRNPFEGLGKPEPLKNKLSGNWSRRIDIQNRVIYQVHQDEITILTCRHHYTNH